MELSGGSGKCQLVAVWWKVRKLCSEQEGLGGAGVLIFINEQMVWE